MPIISKIKTYIKEHKGWTFIIIVAIIGIGYYFYHNAGQTASVTKYVTTTAEKQTVISSISGTGQVAAANSINVTPQVSGTVTQTKVASGQSVKAGQVIATLDQKSTASAIRQARASLASAQASYDKVVAGATSQDLAVSQSSVDSAQANLDNAIKNLDMVKQQQTLAVNNAHSVLLNAGITAVPSPINLSGSNPSISGTYTGNEEGQYVINLYMGSDGSMYYTVNGLESSPGRQIPNSSSISLPLGTHGLYLQFPAATYKSSDSWTINIPNTKATNYLSSYNSYQSALKSQEQSISNAEQSITSAQLNLQQAKNSYALKAEPALPADVATAKAQIDNAQASLQTAIDNYNYTIIKAPFDGQIATLDIQKGDQVGSGTSVATLITHQKVATISLNEIDVAKLKLGQPATLTFDAIDGLSIAGTVSQIDTIGTVTQGVVNYTIKISFDTQDERVKPGMSVSAAIITDSKTDVLAVPSSAIKTSGSQQYVLVLNQSDIPSTDSTSAQIVPKNPPTEQIVETGISSDTLTEITGGLQEGDIVVTQTITSNTKTTAASTGSSVRIPGLTTGGGSENFRGPGG